MMWHNLPVMKAFFAFSGKASRWELRSSLKSFAHMAVAARVGCSFCLDLGYFEAHNKRLDLAKAREVPRWRESCCSRRWSATCWSTPRRRPRRPPRSPTSCRRGC